ncbi:MAG: hypothetical protein HQ565_10450 [Bacteroidetes bacterium]|nr:hypothetical protein [Bacteroidota bacterium]
MKTIRFPLTGVILSFAIIGYAGNKRSAQAKKIVHITLDQALTEPKLVKAMYAQLSISLLRLEQPGFYFVTLIHTGVVYKIDATRDAWIKFFVNRPA